MDEQIFELMVQGCSMRNCSMKLHKIRIRIMNHREILSRIVIEITILAVVPKHEGVVEVVKVVEVVSVVKVVNVNNVADGEITISGQLDFVTLIIEALTLTL
ncbi:hypothetical protein DPMN_082033 [Dreissena polymorpha]|uniref:Uncharacterized protein n=1 Tax=Dreissena polymorpha TaxID=45954 RepID=A0A9D3Y676_DREPO|nr:hypothetical protein DPMN_082033 [Dreissena polymorpha]